MPLKKPPHPAAIFNNFIYQKGNDYVFKVGDGDQTTPSAINIPLLITDAIYKFGAIDAFMIYPSSHKLLKIVDLKGIDPITNEAGVQDTRDLFPEDFVLAESGLVETGLAGKPAYYNKDYGVLIANLNQPKMLKAGCPAGFSKVKAGQCKNDKTGKVVEEYDLYDLKLVKKYIDHAFDSILQWAVSPELELQPAAKKLNLNNNDFQKKGSYDYKLTLDAKAVALADHYFNSEKNEYAFLANDVEKTQKVFEGLQFECIEWEATNAVTPEDIAPPPHCDDKKNQVVASYPFNFTPTTIKLNGVNGVTADPRLNFIKTFLNPDGQIAFDYLNFALKPNNKDVKLAAVTTPSFAEKFMKLGKEPKVPSNAKENNIVSFYHDVLQQHSNEFDENFIYKNPKFSDFEVDVLTASTLVKKSNSYQDFVKPYASVEFFADFKTDPNYKKNNFINTTPVWKNIQEKNNHLKRFVSNKRQLVANLKGVIVNNGDNLVSLHSGWVSNSAAETKFLDNSSYDNNFTKAEQAAKIVNKNRINAIGDVISPKVKSGFCPYEVVGYSITKSTKKPPIVSTMNAPNPAYEKSIIKRIYVLNDKPGHVGYLRYFDSQIKEKVTYYYSIEQINLVYATQLRYTAKGANKAQGSDHKNFLGGDKSYDNVPALLNSSAPGATAATKKDNKNFPFYNTKDMVVDMQTGISPMNHIIYTPVGPAGEFGSPDIEFNDEILKAKISAPDLNIYTREGEINKAQIVLSALAGKSTELVTLKSKNTKLINLGTATSVVKKPVKEYRVYRTTEKPESYKSFSDIPHQTVGLEYPDFTDDILPNVEYYYYAVAVGIHNSISDPSKVLKLIIINEASHVFTLLEVFNFGE